MTSGGLRKVGLVLAGVVMGALGLVFGLWFYLQAARIDEVRTGIGERLRIAREAVVRVRFVEQDAIRFTLRDIALLDPAGDIVFSAPRAVLTLDVPSLDGEGAIEFYDVQLIDPLAYLIQSPAGVWNYEEPLRLTAADRLVETEPGRALIFRDVRIVNGEMVVAIPGEPPTEDTRFAANLPLTQIGGAWYQAYEIADVQSRLAQVRIGGPIGWRVDMASLTARVVEPDLRISQMQGTAEQVGADAFRFSLGTLRFGETVLAGSGLVRFADHGFEYDLEIAADPFRLADFRPIFPNLPTEGEGRLTVAVQTLTPERVAFGFTGMDFEALGSRVLGALSVAVGGEVPVSLLDADLELAPLRLAALEELGLVDALPIVGEISGRVTTTAAAAGLADVDLRMTLVPRADPAVPPSLVFATGSIAVGGAFEEVRLDGLALSVQPLYLAMFRPLLADPPDFLRGTIQGSLELAGTISDLTIADGALAYQVGGAAPTRLVDLSGRIRTEPSLSYEVSAVAQPLTLTTLTELFPAMPFRAATVSGPIRIVGDRAAVRASADLTGPAGGIEFTGSLALAEPARFEVSGTMSAFAAGMLLRPELPIEGPLSGRFAAQGTTDHFEFDVDLTQLAGRFILTGSVTPAVDPPRFQATGEVIDFRVGVLVGDPQLFPDPMSGGIAVAGGGGDPYRFDVDLAGVIGRLDLAGFYLPAAVPSYEVTGQVAGLDISRLPTAVALPTSSLTASVAVRARGTDLETLEGSFAFDATGSTLGGLPLDAAIAQVHVIGGVAVVDTMNVRLESTQLQVSGAWGLLRPAAEPLRYSLTSPDLSVLARLLNQTALIPPQLAGRVEAVGEVGGSVENPIVVSRLEGSNLRFENWRAATLSVDADLARSPDIGWRGSFDLAADDLVGPQIDRLRSIRLQATGSESALSFGLLAQRDARSEMAASGLLELEGLVPRGVALETLVLRIEPAEWELVAPARLRFAPETGLEVENLTLERSGPIEGRIAADGVIPPDGVADLTVSIIDFDLSDLRRITPAAPALDGYLTLDAILTGPVADPELSIAARVDQLEYEGTAMELITFDGVYSARQLEGFGEVRAEGVRLVRADVSIPMDLSLEGMVPSFELAMTEPAAMTIMADSVPFSLVAAMSPGLRDGTGHAQAEIVVGGTLDVPALDGWMRVYDAAMTIEALSVRYSAIQADLALTGSRVVINNLSARSVGTLVAGGTIDFPAGSPPVLAVSAGLDNFRVIDDPSVARLGASAQLSFTGPITEPVLEGWVEIRESTIRVPELAADEPGLELAYIDLTELGPTPDEIAPAGPTIGNLLIDGLELSIAESVWLESNEMRVQISGDLVIFRVADELRIFGALQAVRGTYTLEISAIVREFDVIRGRVQFFGTGDLNPSLDILAGYRVRGATVGRGGDLTILVQLTGSLLSPRIQLTSDTPVPLSEADLISFLLFGQPSFELGGVTRGFAEQLLVQEVVGGLIASELQRPILRAGICDWVRVRPGLTTDLRGLFGGGVLAGAAIECGWELAPDLFLTAQAGLGILGGELTDGRVGLEWQIDDQWLWEASYGSVPRHPLMRIFDPSRQYQLSTDLRRQWEYGRPTQRITPLDLVPDLPEEPPSPPGIPAPPIFEPAASGRNEDEPPTVAGGSS
jgi:hypothetical protein